MPKIYLSRTSILAAFCAAVLLVGFCAPAQGAQSLVVTTNADEDNGTADPTVGTGTSLREAITFANSLTSGGTISFNIPGAGVHTIKLTSSLPEISKPTTIDGYTQPGASVNSNALT